MINLFDINL